MGRYGVEIKKEEKQMVKQLLLRLHLYNKRAFEERVSRKVNDDDIGRYTKRTVAHIISHVQLMSSPEYEAAVAELREIMNKYSGSTWDVE